LTSSTTTGTILLFVILSLVTLVFYAFAMTSMMLAFKKARHRNPWIAYVPIVNYFAYLKVIRVSRWNVLWMLVPLITLLPFLDDATASVISLVTNLLVLVLSIWWMIRYFKAFGMNPHRLWWMLLPGIGTLLVLIFQLQIGFSKKYQYQFM